MSEPKAVTPRARAAFEYAMLEERVSFARAALEDVMRQLVTFNEAAARSGDAKHRHSINVEGHLRRADDQLTLATVAMAVLGS